MFVGALVIIATLDTTQVLINRWIYKNGMCMQWNTAQHGKGTRLWICATTCMNLRNMPSKRSETQQSMCILYDSVSGKFQSQQNRSALSADQWSLGMEGTVEGHRNFGDGADVLEPDYGCDNLVSLTSLPLIFSSFLSYFHVYFSI